MYLLFMLFIGLGYILDDSGHPVPGGLYNWWHFYF
jgi:hypothetical protein